MRDNYMEVAQRCEEEMAAVRAPVAKNKSRLQEVEGMRADDLVALHQRNRELTALCAALNEDPSSA